MIRPLVTSCALPTIVAATWFLCGLPAAQTQEKQTQEKQAQEKQAQEKQAQEKQAQAAQAQENGLKPFMQRKLDHSKAILEGLALEDYQQIAKNAQALSLLSLESTWNVLSTQEYLQHSQDFRRAVKEITEAAHEKNIDKATLGYVDLTIRCVECHKYLRETRSK